MNGFRSTYVILNILETLLGAETIGYPITDFVINLRITKSLLGNGAKFCRSKYPCTFANISYEERSCDWTMLLSTSWRSCSFINLPATRNNSFANREDSFTVNILN